MTIDRKTILLIEDNPSDIALTRRAMEKAGIVHELVVAEDGEEALHYLWGTGPYKGRDPFAAPALILLDLSLPKLPGLEVLRRIRTDSRTRRLPVVALTSSHEEGDLASCYDLGVNGYVRKPISFQTFATAVGQLGLFWLQLNEPPPRAR